MTCRGSLIGSHPDAHTAAWPLPVGLAGLCGDQPHHHLGAGRELGRIDGGEAAVGDRGAHHDGPQLAARRPDEDHPQAAPAGPSAARLAATRAPGTRRPSRRAAIGSLTLAVMPGISLPSGLATSMTTG